MWRLQRSQDSDALFFQEIANRGHYRGGGSTRQGIYVCSSSGKMMSSINSLDADKVLETIEVGLKKWNDLPSSERYLSSTLSMNTIHRWENSYPDEGLIMTSVNADLFTDPPVQANRSNRWNMDHVWFNISEARSWLPDDPQMKDVYELPETLVNRLICFHLVDNVRGQTLPFAPQEVKEAGIEIEVLERQNSTVQIKIRGHSEAVAKGEWLLGENDWTPDYPLDHGMKTNIIGEAEYDLNRNKFTEFEMVAIGKRYGKTKFNSRQSNTESSYVGFLFSLAENGKADKIAPAFVDIYNADWIVKP